MVLLTEEVVLDDLLVVGETMAVLAEENVDFQIKEREAVEPEIDLPGGIKMSQH